MNAPDSGVTVVVDQDRCMGSGYCVTQHPDLFGEDADGTAVSRQTARLSPEQARGAAEAAYVCPAAAIEVRRLD